MYEPKRPTLRGERLYFTITKDIDDDSYEEVEVSVPARIEVCSRCRGRGVHDPAAFSNGFSREDFDEDPDFAEAYFEGRYDVTCEQCGGRNVEGVPDEDRFTEQDRANWSLYVEYRRSCWETESIYRAERAMGA